MATTDENLTTPISGQFKSSPFYVAVSSLPISAFIAIGLTWLCYQVLPDTVADQLVPQLQLYVLGTGAVGSAGGVLGMVKRGLDITNGKIRAQVPPQIDTVNAGTVVNQAAGELTEPIREQLGDLKSRYEQYIPQEVRFSASEVEGETDE